VIGRDGIAGLVCLAGALGLLALTRGMPKPALVPIGPAFYPRILFVVTAVLGFALVVADLTRRQRPKAAPARYRLVALAFAALQAALEGPRAHWLRGLVVAFVTTVATYYVFEVYLSVLLPRGSLTGF